MPGRRQGEEEPRLLLLLLLLWAVCEGRGQLEGCFHCPPPSSGER